MKLIDKLKNALFEEEYVEVEEKPVKPKKEKTVNNIKKEKVLREIKLTNYDDDMDDDEPIAKKIVSPVEVKKEVPKEKPIIPEKKPIEFPTVDVNDYEAEPIVNTNIMDDVNIKVTELEDDSLNDAPVPIYSSVDYSSNSNKEDVSLYKTSKEKEYIKKYTSHEYGNYEKTKEKKAFKPSPNISPIYGIIDDKGESIKNQQKKEVRLTTVTRSEKIDVDDVRRKAFGTLADEIQDNINSYSLDQDDDEDEKLLVDLRDNDAPEVDKVTMGDAEEYFQDLGLEYDTDYIDAKKAKASGRRLKSDYDNVTNESKSKEEVEDDLPDFLKESTDNQTSSNDDDDNLFDLIDSMYDK